jgi:predicted O-methyltransferase YrrM
MPTMIKRTFRFWQSLGIHVVRNHYYQPVPDTRTLKDDLWIVPAEMPGIDFRDREQLALLSRFKEKYGREYKAFPRAATSSASDYYVYNGRYESVDGEILYCMVREYKPKLMLEFGAGFSTLAAAQAFRRNTEEDKSYRYEFISVDPEPDAVIKKQIQGVTRLEKGLAQETPLSRFSELEANDILFVDSSHVLKIGSDVHYLFLQVLPRLKPGVIIHIHDIFLPAEYPKDWVMGHLRFYNEQYLLQAFLTNNSAFEILWAGSYMHLNHPDELGGAIPSYDHNRCLPGSIWIRRKQ